jgi:hypothetical protein
MSDDVKQIIAAYVLGCLDKENLIQFIEYIHRGGKEIEGELGELQNIISLIPILLSPEIPNENIKENIAQKILEIEFQTKNVERKSKIIEENSADNSAEAKESKIISALPLHDKLDSTQVKSDKPQVKKSKITSVFLWFLIFILIGLAGYAYKNSLDANLKIIKLNKKILQLNQEMSVAKNFLAEHSTLIDFLNSDEISIYNFSNLDTNVTASAKLFLSFSKGEGIFSVNISGKISSDESLAIWAVIKNKNILFGEIVYNPLVKYYKLEKIPMIDKNSIKIISVTIQKRRSGEETESRIFMMGKAS